jgi:predicted transcriptional regulator of viral defense system
VPQLFAKVYHFWYTFGMSHYDAIYEYAVDHYGLITSAEALDMHIPNVELVKLSHRGRLIRLGHGVYRIVHYIPTPLDKYAEAVAMTGYGAYIFGESVLAMHELALVNPLAIYVATQNRVRKKLPAHVMSVYRKDAGQPTNYEGIPSQSVFDAILTCRAAVMSERLREAVKEARRQGLITEAEAKYARKEITNGRETAKQQTKS